jgi:hypothetical protein
MKKLILPFVKLPQEFLTLLKSNLALTHSTETIYELLHSRPALHLILKKAFAEFDDGRGLDKTMRALGWANFRERLGSIYLYKSIYGDYPQKTDMGLVEEIRHFEQRFSEHSIHGFSRLYMLGFYLKLANIDLQNRANNHLTEIKVPEEVSFVLKLSQGRSDKIDWLILSILHFIHFLGPELLINSLVSGKKFNDLYDLVNENDRKIMEQNLLAYAASINEGEIFLYEKV